MKNRLTNFFSKKYLLNDWALLLYLALIKFLIPLFTHPDFDFHRDEFLYMAMGDHLSWGYLEVPPFIAAAGKLARALLGSSLFAVRFLPALAGAFTLVLTARLAHEMGGKRFSQVLAASAFLVSLVYLRINLFFMPVAFNLLFFVLAVFYLIRLLNTGRSRYWLFLGATVGVGLLNKYTMLLFGFGMVVGLLLTPRRRFFLSRWPWFAGLLAVILWLPNLLWQHQNGWPFFEHMRILAERQLANVHPAVFLLVQVLMTLYAAPLWLLGLYYLFFVKQGKKYREIGWLYLAMLMVMLVFSGKVYYLAPAYPMLLAAGAVLLERWAESKSRGWLRPASMSLVIAGSLTLLPIGLPILSVENMIGYFDFGSRYMGLQESLRWETGEFHELPQDYADMLGWRAQVAAVAATYYRLPPEEQAGCAIFASNYGEAGAIDFYGKEFGLPQCISNGSSYWLWGYRGYSGRTIIAIGLDREDLLHFYRGVEPGADFVYPHARESGVPIFIARGPRLSLPRVWEILKKYRY